VAGTLLSSAQTLTSRSHLDLWSEASDTLILLDWDDTICPTSYIWGDQRLQWDEVAPCFRVAPPSPHVSDAPTEAPTGELAEMLNLLQAHGDAAVALLRRAATVGRVAIVTLAKEGWVETSIRQFMPALEGLLEELGVEVIYARASLPAHRLERLYEDGRDPLRALKTASMSRIIKDFHQTGGRSGASKSRSWKNIVSIGDSDAEYYGVQDAILCHKQTDRHGAWKECRCKAVKILGKPSLEVLTAEMTLLWDWMEALVCHDGDVDIDFDSLKVENSEEAIRSLDIRSLIETEATEDWTASSAFS